VIALLRATRSAAAFVALVAVLGLGGLYQRLLLWPLSFLAPALASRLSARLMQWLGLQVIVFVRLGGSTVRLTGRVPSDQACLVVMNHQSLLDIPIAALTCRPAFPRYVARTRYRPAPMVGMGIRLTGGLFVDPARDPRGAVEVLRAAGRAADRAIVVYPEGHRSRDGGLGEFETAGLRSLLGASRMPVHLIVADGAWRCRSMKDFILGMHRIQTSTRVAGPFEPPKKGDLRPFVDEMRQKMAGLLEELRSGEAE